MKEQQRCWVVMWAQDREPYAVFTDEAEARKLAGEDSNESGLYIDTANFNPPLRVKGLWEIDDGCDSEGK